MFAASHTAEWHFLRITFSCLQMDECTATQTPFVNRNVKNTSEASTTSLMCDVSMKRNNKSNETAFSHKRVRLLRTTYVWSFTCSVSVWKWKINSLVWVLIRWLRKEECSVIFIWRRFACIYFFAIGDFKWQFSNVLGRSGMWNLCLFVYEFGYGMTFMTESVWMLKWMVFPHFSTIIAIQVHESVPS